uniref:DNA adenine methylase n=1 Tax=Peptoniphilus grossensis TaxID=1465756 RepID=UPI00288B426A|nr:DNA adenine methylase [Peptoniphilus grossensis]
MHRFILLNQKFVIRNFLEYNVVIDEGSETMDSVSVKKANIKKDSIFQHNIINTNKKSINDNVKPFVKWAGGKGQLLGELEKIYPFYDKKIKKYAEPFVGGGAVFFDILNKYDLESIYISDINCDLINAYKVIKNYKFELIELLKFMENEFLLKDNEERKEYYLEKRQKFNDLKMEKNNNQNILKAAYLIFLNKTCFNGLYRVNSKGLFNVPMGSYKNPLICDEKNIVSISEKLKNVEIVCADFKNSDSFIDENTFVYFDPPYRPITNTASFTAYTSSSFNDDKQIELANFAKIMNQRGAKIAISNSDPKNTDENDNFFDDLYSDFIIKRVEANRMINSKANGRGKVKELIITNF